MLVGTEVGATEGSIEGKLVGTTEGVNEGMLLGDPEGKPEVPSGGSNISTDLNE
jgi:hypothetical protein